MNEKMNIIAENSPEQMRSHASGPSYQTPEKKKGKREREKEMEMRTPSSTIDTAVIQSSKSRLEWGESIHETSF